MLWGQTDWWFLTPSPTSSVLLETSLVLSALQLLHSGNAAAMPFRSCSRVKRDCARQIAGVR